MAQGPFVCIAAFCSLETFILLPLPSLNEVNLFSSPKLEEKRGQGRREGKAIN